MFYMYICPCFQVQVHYVCHDAKGVGVGGWGPRLNVIMTLIFAAE